VVDLGRDDPSAVVGPPQARSLVRDDREARIGYSVDGSRKEVILAVSVTDARRGRYELLDLQVPVAPARALTTERCDRTFADVQPPPTVP
jgi:hypothetical protein